MKPKRTWEFHCRACKVDWQRIFREVEAESCNVCRVLLNSSNLQTRALVFVKRCTPEYNNAKERMMLGWFGCGS